MQERESRPREYVEPTGEGDGFVFADETYDDLLEALKRKRNREMVESGGNGHGLFEFVEGVETEITMKKPRKPYSRNEFRGGSKKNN